MLLFDSCSKLAGAPSNDEGGDPTENQPTPILGSGDHILNSGNVVLICTSYYNNDPTLVACIAADSGAGSSNYQVTRGKSAQAFHLRLTQTQTGYVEGTGWASGTTATYSLEIDNGGTITTLTTYQSSNSNTLVVFSLGFDISTEPGAVLTGQIAVTSGGQTTNLTTPVSNQFQTETNPF